MNTRRTFFGMVLAPVLAAVGFKVFKKPAKSIKATSYEVHIENGPAYATGRTVKAPSRIHVVHTIDDRFYVWCHDGVYELHTDLTFHLVAPKIIPPPIEIKRIPDPYRVTDVEIARLSAELDFEFEFSQNMQRAMAHQDKVFKELHAQFASEKEQWG